MAAPRGATPVPGTGANRNRPTGSARWGIMAEPDFRRLWLGRTISHMGDYAFRIAFSTYIIAKTGSPSVLAVSTAALLAPSLVFYLFGGVLSDRVTSRRAVMISVDILRAVVALAIAVGLALTDSVALLVGLALLIGVGEGLFAPAAFTFQKEIIPAERIASANSAMSVSQQIGLIAGPLLGGLLVGLAGSTMAFVFDAVTFVISAVFIARIHPRPVLAAQPAGAQPATGAPPASRGPAGVLRDLAGGFGYVRRERWLSITLIVGPAANAAFSGILAVTVPLIMAPAGTADAAMLGQFYAVQAIGAFTAAAFITPRVTFTYLGRPLFATLAMMAAAMAGVGLLGRTPVAYLMALLYGIGLHVFNTIYPTLLHEKVPDAVMSRVSSLSTLCFTGLMPVGQLLIGPLADGTGPRAATFAAGAAAAVACVGATLAPSIKLLRRPATQPAPAPAG